MAKSYDQSDFDQVVFHGNNKPTNINHANDDVSRVYGAQESPKQRASYQPSHQIPAIGNDDIGDQKARGIALQESFEQLAELKKKGRLSEQQYRTQHKRLLAGALTMCRDPDCNASPVSKKKSSVDGIAQRLSKKSNTCVTENEQGNSKDNGIEH